MPICEGCGCEFPKDPYHKAKKFCTIECFQASRKKNVKPKMPKLTVRKSQLHECCYGLDVVLKLPNYNNVDSLEGIPCFGCSESMRCDATKCIKMIEWLEAEEND